MVDTADLTFNTNGNMVQAFVMDAYASLYDFSAGGFRSQLRDVVDDNISLFEWSTLAGNLIYAQSYANGSITYTANPAPLDTLTLGSTVVTWVSGTPVGNQVKVGATLALSIAAFTAFANASLDSQISLCTYSGSGGTVLNIIYKTGGLGGNVFPIATTSTGATISGATLSGGGGVLTMTASVLQIEDFGGTTYVYDVRYENGPTIAVLFGGTITFVKGVTRDATIFG